MGSHDTVDVIFILPQLVEKPRRESALAVITVHHQLRDPTDLSTMLRPSARKDVTRKAAIHQNSHIGGDSGGKILCAESLLAQSDAAAFEQRSVSRIGERSMVHTSFGERADQ